MEPKVQSRRRKVILSDRNSLFLDCIHRWKIALPYSARNSANHSQPSFGRCKLNKFTDTDSSPPISSYKHQLFKFKLPKGNPTNAFSFNNNQSSLMFLEAQQAKRRLSDNGGKQQGTTVLPLQPSKKDIDCKMNINYIVDRKHKC